MIVDNLFIEQALLTIISKGKEGGINKDDLLRRLSREELIECINSCLLRLLEQKKIEVIYTNTEKVPVFRERPSRIIYQGD